MRRTHTGHMVDHRINEVQAMSPLTDGEEHGCQN